MKLRSSAACLGSWRSPRRGSGMRARACIGTERIDQIGGVLALYVSLRRILRPEPPTGTASETAPQEQEEARGRVNKEAIEKVVHLGGWLHGGMEHWRRLTEAVSFFGRGAADTVSRAAMDIQPAQDLGGSGVERASARDPRRSQLFTSSHTHSHAVTSCSLPHTSH
ncbi:MAG: hypothetical protein SGPRY_006080 [Prymnesium sp.]